MYFMKQSWWSKKPHFSNEIPTLMGKTRPNNNISNIISPIFLLYILFEHQHLFYEASEGWGSRQVRLDS